MTYQHIRHRNTAVTVRAEWYRLWPGRGRNYRFWHEVARRVKERRVRHGDHGRIKEIAAGVDREVAAGRFFL